MSTYDPSKARVFIGGREIEPAGITDFKVEISLPESIISQLRTLVSESSDAMEAVEKAFRLGCQYVVNVDVKEGDNDD
jgi:hypothetical protein